MAREQDFAGGNPWSQSDLPDDRERAAATVEPVTLLERLRGALEQDYWFLTNDGEVLLADALPAVVALIQTVQRFVKYAEEYPEDISGPLRDDFFPQLPHALAPFVVSTQEAAA